MADLSQQQAFQERLARMGHAQQVAPVAEPVAETPRPKTTKQRPINDWRENIKYPLSFVGAFFIGVISVFVARFVRFTTSGGGLTGEEADLLLMMDGAMALAIGFALRMAFGIEGNKELVAAKTAGITAMAAIMHNAVHAWPAVWAAMFSPEWVDEVVMFTEPSTILLGGYAFQL